MPEAIRTARLATLAAFGEAWAARDIDKLMALMTEGCIYAASVGPEPGTRFVGANAVRQGIKDMLAHDDSDHSEVTNVFIDGDRAACEWRYFKTDDGTHRLIAHGCDLFRFSGDKIAVKEAFRKTETS